MKIKEIKLELVELALKIMYEEYEIAKAVLKKIQLEELSESFFVKNENEIQTQTLEFNQANHKVGSLRQKIRTLTKNKDEGNFKSKNVIEAGSLVTIENGTTKHYLFLEECGNLVLKHELLNYEVITVSKNSAMYFALHNKKEGDKVFLGNNQVKVLKVE